MISFFSRLESKCITLSMCAHINEENNVQYRKFLADMFKTGVILSSVVLYYETIMIS